MRFARIGPHGLWIGVRITRSQIQFSCLKILYFSQYIQLVRPESPLVSSQFDTWPLGYLVLPIKDDDSLGLGLEVPGSLLEVPVAFLIRPTGTEAGTDEGGPRAALKKEDGEDNAESDAEGGLDKKVGDASVPL